MKQFIATLYQLLATIILNIFSIIKALYAIVINKPKQISSNHARTIIIASFISL